MSEVSELLARQRIVDVLLRYARGVDRRDWSSLPSCFHPGAVEEAAPSPIPIEDVLSGLPRALARFAATQHLICQVAIELADTKAMAETYAVAVHVVEGQDGSSKLDTWGLRYVDRFDRRQESWKISRRAVVREWRLVETIPAGRGRRSLPGYWGAHTQADPIYWILGEGEPPAESYVQPPTG